MKILITGSSGMLGRALCQKLADKYEILGLDILNPTTYHLSPITFIKCDITDRDKAVEAISSAKPQVIIHTAAYTDVDGCERNPEQAHRVNALGTQTLALAAQECNALLVYISTDFVFDGTKNVPYVESDQPNPINIYGKSKYDGERYVQSILKEFAIVRSSWLFGQGGKNFVDTLLSKAKSEEKIEVVDDQRGSPTYAKDLAQAIGRLLNLTYVLCPTSYVLEGIFHITNSGSCSRYEFARTIKEISSLKTDIAPVSSQQYRGPTRRPKMSILENLRYRAATGENLRPWKEALGEYLLK